MSQNRSLGGNIGLAIATIILNQHLQDDLQGILTETQINNIRHSLTAMSTLSSPQVHATQISFSKAFRTQMEVCMCVAAAALLSGLCSWQRHPLTFAENERGLREDAKQETTQEQTV